MTRFVGLRPKLYAFQYTDCNGQTQGKNTAKGVQKAVKKRLSFEDYEDVLRNMSRKSVTVNSIRSDKHHLYTYKIEKVGLSANDDKRFICENGVNTYAHGHYRLNSSWWHV